MSPFDFLLYLCMSVSAGIVSWNSEPQPKARPSGPGPGTGLFPGDGPTESPRHSLQEWVRESKTGGDGEIQAVG